MPIYTIRVTQKVKKLSDWNDSQELPAGPDGKGSYKDYKIEASSRDSAYVLFHSHSPIGCKDEFAFHIINEE